MKQNKRNKTIQTKETQELDIKEGKGLLLEAVFDFVMEQSQRPAMLNLANAL